MSSGNAAVPPHPDSESDDTEVGHLQALLETKGLPPNLFSALGKNLIFFVECFDLVSLSYTVMNSFFFFLHFCFT